MDINQAKKIMGNNFIGPEELQSISDKLDIADLSGNPFPEINYSEEVLRKASQNCLLVLGVVSAQDGQPLTLNKLRTNLGWDSVKSEPCFYNQDWYLKEKFASETVLDRKWYLINKNVVENTRGKSADEGKKALAENSDLPPAILTAFTFFAYYFLTGGEALWKNDFIWCADKDNNGDRIYTGRYIDPNGINNNGFNVHRHLSIRPCYGTAPQIL